MVDLIFIPLAILILYGVKLTKPLKELDTQNYLSLDTCRYYRGLFAVVVVLGHISQNIKDAKVFTGFSSLGYLAVAFFFFVSGYGLQKSYISKSDAYRKGFLLKRLPTVLIPYIIITAVYWLMLRTEGQHLTLKDIISAIIKGNPVVLYSWYIISILLFYVVFWLLMTVFRKHYFLMTAGCLAWCVLLYLFCLKMKYGSWWYNATHMLAVGMFWAAFEGKILEFLKKTYAVITPSLWALFIAFFFFKEKVTEIIDIPYSSKIISLLDTVLFVLCILTISMKVRIGNKVLKLLGEMSLEIYISHGIFLTVFRGENIYIENDLLCCTAVLAGTFALSYVLHIVFGFILKKYRAMLIRHNI